MVAVGLLPALNTPFVLDYVHQDSLGLAAAWINMISLFAQLLSTSGALVIDETLPIKFLFIFAGAITLGSTVILLFGLKEVHYQRKVRYFQSVHSNSILSQKRDDDHL